MPKRKTSKKYLKKYKRKMRGSSKKTNRKIKKTRKKTRKTHKKELLVRSPTSISFEKEKSPQIIGENMLPLTKYTTKNIEVGSSGHNYNVFIDGKLAYKRAPRGSDPDQIIKVRWGPQVFRLTKDNYKKLKMNDVLYLDRESVFFRGPFKYDGLLKGPKIKLKARDVGYNITYNFTIDVNDLDKYTLYVVVKKK